MAPNPSLSWEKLQNVFYRSRKLHNLQWSSKKDLRYAISRTFIAIETDKSIQIFNYLGQLLTEIDIKVFDVITEFHFDELDQRTLIVVGLQTCKLVKTWAPLEIKTINLPSKTNDTLWDVKGNVYVTKVSKDVLYLDLEREKFKFILKNEARFNILTKKHWHCNENMVIILDTESVYQLDILSRRLTKFQENNEWHKVALSKDGFICLYNAKYNKLDIFRDSGKLLLQHTLDLAPDDIRWCGDDSIACTFNDTVKLYGPEGEYVSFWYSSNIFCIKTEIDGLKVFTDTEIYLITKVPRYTADIYCMGSTEAGSMLLDAWYVLSTHTARAIDYLKDFDLAKGVNDCIMAAQEEMDTKVQKELLNAASFGKSMLSYNEFDSNIFVKACDNIKLLNIFRDLGFFFTYFEYKAMGFEAIIEMMLLSHKFYESLKICTEFKNFELMIKVVQNWSETKIKLSQDIDDDDLFGIINKRLTNMDVQDQVSAAQLSQVSFNEGRFILARRFAMIEKSAEMKVLSLIKLDDHLLATQESLKSYCPEFIVSVLLLLKNTVTNLQFMKILVMILPKNSAYTYFERNNYEFLFDIYRQTDKYNELAHAIFSHNRKDVTPFLPQIKDLYSSVIDDTLLKQDTEYLKRNEKLVEFQEELTHTLGFEFPGLTVVQTLEKLVSMKQDKKIKAFVKMFKISDKKYYHIMCRTLIKEKRFDNLYEFATHKKSPIGYQPFFKYLTKAGKHKESARYIPMISEMPYKEKIKTLYEIKGYFELAQMFTKEKNILALKELYQQVPVNEAQLRSFITETISKI
ncbi:similar to Saccharomyces cerevisiae YPL045W VPS16 Subunit of the vacuole fusion and protein sorting HOPS complex and the CORVET tethering complex [Maudiozyma saulgeensis]|uniref:Probable vacuolar protein sorting-associated protein 16 homolog n=1 Tax=Maudiozyma saulgeensis TaxID=1789683 RepID=A0A1X7R8D3_9SACH|nr:similar to Saccharomyces cerevisiae YPL045W VPS16 Subunit of the vacuole fusion and protein sorting HOPS complex and the CORVET tethering complex [Kazachstania saulgeensis]